MVGLVKSANILTWLLICLIDRNSLPHNLNSVKHKCDAVEQISPAGFIFNIEVKFFFVALWDHVPSFNIPCMAIIQRIKP